MGEIIENSWIETKALSRISRAKKKERKINYEIAREEEMKEESSTRFSIPIPPRKEGIFIYGRRRNFQASISQLCAKYLEK